MSVQVRHRSPSVFLPVLLLLGGALLLLLALDALPEGAGWRLLVISPLILVMLGLQIVIRRLLTGQAAVAMSLAAVGLVGLVGLAYVSLGPAVGTGSVTTFTSTSPVAGVTSGTLRVDGTGSRISIIFSDIGADLYRARVGYSGTAPKLDYANGALRLSSSDQFLVGWGRSPDQYTLTLSKSVPWSIAIRGAGTTAAVELLGGQLRSFTFDGVGSNLELSLGSPSGTVPVEVSGVGAKLAFTVPAGAAYRAKAEGIGATVGGVRESNGWSTTTNRYDVIGRGVGLRIEARTR
jgi:hypothetical protein